MKFGVSYNWLFCNFHVLEVYCDVEKILVAASFLEFTDRF